MLGTKLPSVEELLDELYFICVLRILVTSLMCNQTPILDYNKWNQYKYKYESIQIQIQSKEEEEMAVESECHLVASWREEVAQGAPAIGQRGFS